MHASIDNLLSLRDGQPVDAAIAAHMEQCQRCTAELHKLREMQSKLQSLPQLEAPSSFAEIQRAMARPAAEPRRLVSPRLVAALAFVTLTAIFFVALRDETAPQVRERTVLPPHSQQEQPTDAIEHARVPELMAQSQHLEDLLQRLPGRPQIERVSTAAMIDTIEDRIQWLDFQLSDAPDSGLNEEQTQRLWRERVELMDSLVKVRYAEGGVSF
jgi:anti-sigma factor RsiW